GARRVRSSSLIHRMVRPNAARGRFGRLTREKEDTPREAPEGSEGTGSPTIGWAWSGWSGLCSTWGAWRASNDARGGVGKTSAVQAGALGPASPGLEILHRRDLVRSPNKKGDRHLEDSEPVSFLLGPVILLR